MSALPPIATAKADICNCPRIDAPYLSYKRDAFSNKKDDSYRLFLHPTTENLGCARHDARKTLRVDTYLQYLTADHTVYGVTFQNWMPFVVGILLVSIGLLKSVRGWE